MRVRSILIPHAGAGGMAFAGAHIRTQLGSYDLLWFVTGVIAMAAAFLVFLDRYEAPRDRPREGERPERPLPASRSVPSR